MNKLLKNPSYRSNTGYSGNDLSHTIDFTSTVGQAIPVSWDILQPGDKIKQQVRLKTRTQPLITAAFGEIEEHVRTFFVPFSQIYKPYEQLFNGIQDYGSDFYNAMIVNNRLSDILPIVSLGQIYDYLLSVLPTSTQTPASVFYDKLRLLEMIGLPMNNIVEFFQGTDQTWRSHSVNLLPFMAYQKIWYDYFRDTDRIVNDPQAYNYDSWVDSTNHTITSARLEKFLSLHYVPCKRDTVNNLFVSPVFGESGVGGDKLNTLVNSVNNWLTSQTPAVVGSDGSMSGAGSKPTSVRPSDYNSTNLPATAINVASLRSSFAVNKLLEITRRAHKHYDAQILAHFGVKVPMGINGESFEVGHHEQELVIGDVISTADTLQGSTGSALGEIGGKGYSHEVSDFETFEASTHGILMTIYYSRPRYVYEQTGIDKKLAYTKISDFPREEYDELGMQPKFLMNMKLSASAASNAAIEQYEYRYSEVKSAMSRALLGMSRSLRGWVISREPVFVNSDDFYVKPSDINQIMAVPYSDYLPVVVPNASEQTLRMASLSAFDSDPFMNHLLLVYKKTSKLSTYGLMDI